MATEFAISRFLTPILARRGWALFMDCDILARVDVNELFDQADPSKAVMCVKHVHQPPEGIKMDGQLQTLYARKNWSSVMLFNCEHPANRMLSVALINAVPGRDLHRFMWLKDDEIGALDPSWNFLVGHTDASVDPKLVHFTEGGPWFEAYRDVPYAGEWFRERSLWLNDEILEAA
jgi:lipopolysaccharide biosynthesis glycosyltransferase